MRLSAIAPPPSYAPPTPGAAPVIGWVRSGAENRSERPFISSLGRWTLHLISDKGHFSFFSERLKSFVTPHFYGLWLLIFTVNFFHLLRARTHIQGDCREERWVCAQGPWALCSCFCYSFCFFWLLGGAGGWWARLNLGVRAKGMGAPLSKTAGKADTVADAPGEPAASATKSNGQVKPIDHTQLPHIHQAERLVAPEEEGGGGPPRGGSAPWQCGTLWQFPLRKTLDLNWELILYHKNKHLILWEFGFCPERWCALQKKWDKTKMFCHE